MKININVAGKTLTASLADNATARDCVSVLPLNVPISGGSWATASLTPAVLEAARNATRAIVLAATKAPESLFKGKQEDDLEFADGVVRLKGPTEMTLSPSEILKLAKAEAVSGKGRSQGVFGDKRSKYSFHSFGAQFAEVT